MKPSRRLCQAAFSLCEVMVALGLFGITATAAISAMLRMNTNASLSRLQTGASTAAQNQIDLVLSDSPFNPQKNQIPPELTIGTTINGSSANPTIAVYTDPKTGQQVKGWMTTTVADTGATLNGNSLYAYTITVVVNYKFKGRPYLISMSTLRCSDI